MGAVTPIGNNVESFRQGLLEGKNGVAPIQAFDTENFKAKLAGEIKDLDFHDFIDKKDARRMDRFTKLAVVAAEEAAKQANLDGAYDPFDINILVTSGIGGLTTMEENMTKYIEKGPGRVSPFFIPMNIVNMATGEIAIRHKAMGASYAPVSACASGTHAIGEGFRAIKHGYAKAAIVGGAEGSVTPMAIAGFSNMKALNDTDDVEKGSMPFDQNRGGFVIGEGAGVLILENLDDALKRGATILGEVVGYGATTDAYHITAPHPEGKGAYMAMKRAVDEAGIEVNQVSYINAHGTSTPMNDQLESMAVVNLFGDKMPITSTKSMTGHLLGAAGAIEAIACVLSMQDGVIPKTINTKDIDEKIKADVVILKNREQKITYVLSNSLGFGGHNASLLFKKWED